MNNRLVALLTVALVAGCGNSEQAGTGDKRSAARAPAAAGADAVAAVLQSPGTPIAKLGYVLLARPVVGVQSALRLDISAPTPVAMLQLAGEPTDALALDSATASASLALPAGTPVSHELRFTPQRDGLTGLTVRLRAGEGSAETVYVIPVLVAKATAGD